MTILQAAILGAIQGATEFLPISSSGHLVLVPALLGWKEPEVAFDVLLHGATILAVLIFFRRDLISLAAGTVGELKARKLGRDGKLVLLLVIGTVPAAIAGVALKDFFEGLFSNPVAVGGFLLVTAAVMVAADYFGKNAFDADELSRPGALAIGVAQAAAIAPGVSRSGATISAGMLLGLERRAAARFSFLLSIPIVAGTVVLKMGDMSLGKGAIVPSAVGFAVATVVGYGCIAFLLKYLSTHNLRPFAIYCGVVGASTIAFFLLKS